MGIINRTALCDIASGSVLAALLFTGVLLLQRVSKLFELLVRSSADPATVGYLVLLIMPPVLTFTVPLAVLAGVLLTLSRMSSDGEITAMRAAGIPSRRLYVAVVAFALPAMGAAAATALWLTPISVRETYRVLNRLAAAQLTAEIQPRVFEEQFPNTILYVRDVIPGPVVRWRNVFLADITPPEERRNAAHESGEGPTITFASEAIATPIIEKNRIQLSLLDGATFAVGKQWSEYNVSSFPRGERVLEAAQRSEIRPTLQFTQMDTIPLARAASTLAGKERIDAQIELHQRWALPPACLLLALIGVPLGVSSRKGGKASALVLTVLIAFLYYMSFSSLIGLARQGAIPVWLAAWLPNMVLGVMAAVLLLRLELPGDKDLVGSARIWLSAQVSRLDGRLHTAPEAMQAAGGTSRLPLAPQIVDTYVLNSFLFYFGLWLLSFLLMTHIFTFFELLSDIVKNRIAMATVGTYLVFLTPHLIYVLTPVSVLVAVLVTFGVLTKNNEITALKACGVSLYRLAIPVFLACSLFSASLFAFDHYYIPQANLVQDALRNQIKGRPVQTYLRPDRKWIFGEGFRIYYYKHFDQAEGVMVGVSVFELDPATFRLQRHIYAERARWEASLRTWVFQNGWARDLRGAVRYREFANKTETFPGLAEPPSYFFKEIKQDKQMNFRELAAYISELQQSGFETVRLQVQYHKKFATPLFALIMAMLAVPFSFLIGSRGAMAGVGISFGIGLTYWTVSLLFEQVGNVSQLPPVLAAWAPDAVFTLAGLYLLARIRT